MSEEDYKKLFIELGNKIASLRKEQKLTQTELGKRIGVSQQLIATYENAERHLPLISLFKISEELHVSIEELLGLEQKGKPGPVPKIRKRLEQIQQLPPSKQKMILDFLDSYVQNNSI